MVRTGGECDMRAERNGRSSQDLAQIRDMGRNKGNEKMHGLDTMDPEGSSRKGKTANLEGGFWGGLTRVKKIKGWDW